MSGVAYELEFIIYVIMPVQFSGSPSRLVPFLELVFWREDCMLEDEKSPAGNASKEEHKGSVNMCSESFCKFGNRTAQKIGL